MKVTVKKEYDYGTQIVILQRGWVFVGEMTRVGNECELRNAACVRSWGTSKGLGEIAKNGPTENTKLDPCPTVRFHYLTMVGQIECEASKWEKALR